MRNEDCRGTLQARIGGAVGWDYVLGTPTRRSKAPSEWLGNAAGVKNQVFACSSVAELALCGKTSGESLRKGCLEESTMYTYTA